MLKGWLRLIVVASLGFTVPIQGIAAVQAGLCHELEDHGAAPLHDHGAGGHAHDAGTAHHHHGGDGTDQSSQDAHCPPCVSCCAATAIASFPPVLDPQQPATALVAASPASFDGPPPGRLDRPPLAL